MIDGVAHGPVLRRGYNLALHEPSSGIFRIAERLLDRGTVDLIERFEDRFLLGFVKILENVDDIVRFKFADGFSQNLRLKRLDHLIANVVVDLRQDLAVDVFARQLQDRGPVVGIDLFEKVSDVGRVQRFENLGQTRVVTGFGRLDGCGNNAVLQHIFVFGVVRGGSYLVLIGHDLRDPLENFEGLLGDVGHGQQGLSAF